MVGPPNNAKIPILAPPLRPGITALMSRVGLMQRAAALEGSTHVTRRGTIPRASYYAVCKHGFPVIMLFLQENRVILGPCTYSSNAA